MPGRSSATANSAAAGPTAISRRTTWISPAPGEAGANTTLACVATDAALSRAQCQRVAVMAQDGLARAIRPVHSPLDGDTVFVLATGERALADPVGPTSARIGAAAADCLARACARGVFEAETIGDLTAYRDRHPAVDACGFARFPGPPANVARSGRYAQEQGEDSNMKRPWSRLPHGGAVGWSPPAPRPRRTRCGSAWAWNRPAWIRPPRPPPR